MTYRDDVQKLYRQERYKGLRASQALLSARYNVKYGEHSKKRRVLPSLYEAYDGEKRNDLPNGWFFIVTFKHDDFDNDPPWARNDGHGVVLKWSSRDDTLQDWVLHQDRYSYRYYDWKASLRLAIKEWGCTTREEAMKAVKSDYEYLRRWCNDQWWYVGMIVELRDEDERLIDENSCWGYESDSMEYLCDQARSWAASMIKKERKLIRAAALAEHIANRFNDAMECGL